MQGHASPIVRSIPFRILLLAALLSLYAAAAVAQMDESGEVRSYTIQQGVVVPTMVFPTDPGVSPLDKDRRGSIAWPMREVSRGPKMGGKLWRGVNNVAFGWIEIPKNIIIDTVKVDPFSGFFTGLFKGTARTVERTGIGAVEMLTFWHEWPNEYGPVMEPEFVLGDFHD